MSSEADGVARLYRNYDPQLEQGQLQMVSSFRALHEIVPARRMGSGLILDWKQSGGSLLAGGDSRTIRFWDAHTETHALVRLIVLIHPCYTLIPCPQDLETNSDAPMTSMVSDYGSASTFVAGFADGTVRVFDRRLEEEDAIVRLYDAHGSWVQNVRWHPNLGAQILTSR